jgi:hypothetical protein
MPVLPPPPKADDQKTLEKKPARLTPEVTPREAPEPLPMPRMALQMTGRPGLRRSGGYVTEEFLRELEGRRGMRVYREMLDNCPLVGAAMLMMAQLLKQVEWWWEPEEPGNPDDEEAAECLEQAWKGMESPWSMLVDQIGRMTWGYGFLPVEIVYKKGEGGKLTWRKWQPLAPESLWEWEFDDFDEPVVFVQQSPTDYVIRKIPLNKCIHFRTSSAKANPEGRSLLRNAYVPWFYRNRLQEIEAIGLERNLAGMPMMKIPARYMSPDASAEEKAFYEACQVQVRNVRRDENEGLIVPSDLWPDTTEPLVSFELLAAAGQTSSSSGGGIDTAITRHEQRIVGSFLADFLLLGQEAVGSFALSDDKTNLFAVTMGAFLKDVAGEVSKQGGETLLRLNAMPGKANLRAGDLEKGAIDKTVEALSKMLTAGLIVPDPKLQEWGRELIGAPKVDEEFVDEYGKEADPSAEARAQEAMALAGQPGQPMKPGGARSVNMEAGGVKVGLHEKAPALAKPALPPARQVKKGWGRWFVRKEAA